MTKGAGRLRLKYDFHIHSCLSPCGADDMTPGNIVGMARLCGLDAIAIADHNSCRNVPAAVAQGEQNGIVVVPAMELTTAEEVHVLCLFESVAGALEFSDYVHSRLPPFENKNNAFGVQTIINENDRPIGIEEKLLASAADITIDKVADLVKSYGGFALPAHVDRPSFSLYANLGFWDDSFGFSMVELSPYVEMEDFFAKHPELFNLPNISDSDAHDLIAMLDGERTVSAAERTAKAIVQSLREKR